MKPVLNRRGWLSLGVIWTCGAGVALADWPAFERDIQQDVIPVDGRDTAAEIVRQDMGEALGSVLRTYMMGKRPAAMEEVTPESGYLLAGNLFGDGGFFALYEPRITPKTGGPTLALAEYREAEWKLRGLWITPVCWVSKEPRWIGTMEYNHGDDTPSKPFTLEDLTGDGVPEVVVAGEWMKYHRVSHVFGFNKATRGLDLLTHSMAKPVATGDGFRTYEASGNKATWRQWRFMEWRDGKLREKATWRDETSMDGQSWFWQATVPDRNGTVHRYRITMGESETKDITLYEVKRDDAEFARVSFGWNKENTEFNEGHHMAGAWFFRKLTGMPHERFPQTRSYSSFKDGKQVNHENVPPALLEKHAAADVAGTPEARELLGAPE